MEMILIEPNSPEWNYMWQWLAEHPINEGIEDPRLAINNGEAWQYLGSWKNSDRVLHSFRHRNHPLTNRVESLSLKGSENLTSEQIKKSIKI